MFNCERRIMCAFVVFLSLFLLLNTAVAKDILEPIESFLVQGSRGYVPKSPSEKEMEWTCTKPTKICPRYRSAAINRHYHNEFWRTQFVNNGSDFLITWTHFSNYCVYIIEGRNAKVQSLASYPSGNILKAKGNHLLVPVAKDLLKVCTAHTIFMEEVGSDCVTTDTLSVGPNATFEGLFWTFQFTDVDDDLSVQHVFEVRWNLLELLPSDAPGFLKIKGYGGQYYTQERPGDFNETGLYRQIVPFSQECQSLHALFDCTTKTRDYSLAIVDADFSIFSAGENITSAAMPVSGLDITIDNERVKTISWNRQPDDRKYVLAWKKNDQSWVSTMEIDLSFPRYSFPKMEFENCVLYDFRIKRITDRGVESCWTEKSFLFPGPLNVTSQLGGSNAFADDLQVRFHDDSPPCAGGYRVRLGRMDKIGIWESEVQVPKSKSVVHFRGISECPSAYIIQVEVIPNFATSNEIVVPAENRSIALEHKIQSSNCHLKVVNETAVRLYWKVDRLPTNCNQHFIIRYGRNVVSTPGVLQYDGWHTDTLEHTNDDEQMSSLIYTISVPPDHKTACTATSFNPVEKYFSGASPHQQMLRYNPYAAGYNRPLYNPMSYSQFSPNIPPFNPSSRPFPKPPTATPAILPQASDNKGQNFPKAGSKEVSPEAIAQALAQAGITIPPDTMIIITGKESGLMSTTFPFGKDPNDGKPNPPSLNPPNKPKPGKPSGSGNNGQNFFVNNFPFGKDPDNNKPGKPNNPPSLIPPNKPSKPFPKPPGNDNNGQNPFGLFSTTGIFNPSSQSSKAPGPVPTDMAAVLNIPEISESNVQFGSVVGIFGREPEKEICAADQTGNIKCDRPKNGCGQSLSTGNVVCVSPHLLATQNPLTPEANMAFHLGVQQLGQQLLGREPFSDVSNLRDDSEKSAYYWRYVIYYHVSDKAAGLWMGHVQIYLEAYEWTLGLYYYIDPNGDLRLMYYSVTPSDGYVAEEAIWPKFVPYEWMSDERKLIA